MLLNEISSLGGNKINLSSADRDLRAFMFVGLQI